MKEIKIKSILCVLWIAFFSMAIFDLSDIPCKFQYIVGIVLGILGLFLSGMYAEMLIEDAIKTKELEKEVKKDDKD